MCHWSTCKINFDDVLAYELAAYQHSMFNPDGEMKITKSKSTLKRKLQVAISERNCPFPDTVIYYVSALLWILNWPSDKLHVYVDGFLLFVHEVLQKSNVTLVFDRYFPKFVCATYGKISESCTSLTECRIKMWRFKTGKSGASSTKLCSLAPTDDALIENINRCHLQIATWKTALEEPPTMDPTSYGWNIDHQGILLPRTVPPDTLCAPANILKLIHCNCKTSGFATVYSVLSV